MDRVSSLASISSDVSLPHSREAVSIVPGRGLTHAVASYALILNGTLASFYVIIGSFNGLVTLIGDLVSPCYKVF